MLPTSIQEPTTRRQLIGAGLTAAFGSWAALQLLDTGRASAEPVTASTATPSGRVSVIGDSLTIGTMRYQATAFTAAGWASSTVDAHGSRGVRTKLKADPHTGLTAVDAIRAKTGEPDVWVIALGTNDAGLYSNAKQPDIIRQMADRIGAGHKTLWVNVYRADLGRRQDVWNTTLAQVAGERPNDMFVFDWATLAEQNPKWMAADKVHCTAKGYENRSNAIAVASRQIVPIVGSGATTLRPQCVKSLPM